ncbi:bacterial regulatory helix-turn-helix s, AraC family protein [Burkholderia thailandensis MSMB121]|uniref:helix-turn-helix transcriptional regulator n=1 Tax=Burkholderia humptydooensis TaxID=430531 RepID=UPI000327EF3F|nr:AraC family transcriptional regulator [Burkholderia humptydooensis]AGK49049.1 bacterial regulatory helix-turn-helix s, AraC family protein [Burkholderia thailandensis MSMB121]KST75104.1 AraC family transcriptional regulator [Burkholderia humptydooensis]
MELRQKSVSARIHRGLFDAARANGFDTARVADLLGLAEADLDEPHRRVPGDRHVAAMRLASGWTHGWLRPPPDIVQWLTPFPEFAGVVCNAATLRDALRQYAAYRPLVGDVDWLLPAETRDAIAFEYVIEGDGRRAICAFANLAILAALARLYDPAAQMREPEFTGSAFAPASALAGMLLARPAFDAPRNRIVIASTRLDAPFERFNGALAAIQRHAADDARERLRARVSFGAAVERCLRDWLRATGDGDAPPERLLGHVCERFAISRWTLRRRLHHEALTFHALVTRARIGEAERLLLHTRLPIGEIGARVGFGSTSAFSRFFAREHGAAPSRYREDRRDKWH